MNVRTPKKNLAEALSHLERLIPNRSSNPALTQLKANPLDRGLAMSGTNLEIDLEIVVPAEISDGAAFVAPAGLFAQIVRSLPGEMVELQLKGTELTIASGGATFNLQTGDLANHPELNFPSHHDLELDAKELARSIGAVRYAAASEEFRAVFRGVQLELRPSLARVVATDGFRLAYRNFEGGTNDSRRLVIPARNADEIIRVIRDGVAKLSIGQGSLAISSDGARLNVKLMDGELPDYERVIPQSSGITVELEASALKEAVSRVAVVADKVSNNKVELMVQNNRLSLAAESDSGKAQDSLEVKQSGEAAITIAFRAKQLLEALGPIEGVATIGLGQNTPAVFKSANDAGYLAIVNPLRV